MASYAFLEDILQNTVPRGSFAGQPLGPQDFQLDGPTLASLISQFTNNLNHSGAGPSNQAQPECSATTKNKANANNYVVKLGMRNFKPEEISVKALNGNEIVIEGKHEEREDETGFVSRQVRRRIVVPEEFDMALVQSKLVEGVLIITVPRIKKEEAAGVDIPIQIVKD